MKMVNALFASTIRPLMLPNWLKQLAAECPEGDRRQLEERLMSTADPTIYDRQKRYREAQAERGLKLVKVWVPEGAVTTIKAVATELREGHKRG